MHRWVGIFLLAASSALADAKWVRFDGTVPPAVADKESPFLKDGYLDVTLYGADSSGALDSTRAIQKAVNDARDFGYIVFFPSGTYLVSDTIECAMITQPHNSKPGVWRVDGATASVLEGSTRGRKPLIRLADNSPGFGDPNNPKLVFDFWYPFDGRAQVPFAQRSGLASGFNQSFRKIDLDLGQGNPGAIGIYLNGAQGGSLEDVVISAYGAWAGVYDLPGRSMGAVNLTVLGGKYGIYLNQNNLSILAGIVLKDQTERAIHFPNGMAPQSIVGFRIVKKNAPAVELVPGGHQAGNSLLFYDGSIEIEDGGADPVFDNAARRSLYLRNVYVKGAGDIVRYGDATTLAAKGEWTRIVEYAGPDLAEPHPFWRMIEGRPDTGETIEAEAASAPTEDFVARHGWPTLPAFEDADAKNVKDPDIGAKADGIADDRDALQKAIDSHRKVFLPAGNYAISGTLRFGKDTQFFGASLKSVSLTQHPSWKPVSEEPMIETEDSRDGAAYLGNIMFRTDISELEHDYVSSLHWRVGANSIVKSIRWHALNWVGPPSDEANRIGTDVRAIRIGGSGGGRWYLIDAIRGYGTRSLNPGQRLIVVENTVEPLTFYGHDIETCLSDCMTEIRGARNVRVFATKTERGAGGYPLIRIVDSDNVFVGGLGGHARSGDGKITVEVVDSTNVALAMICGGVDGRGYNPKGFVVSETVGGATAAIDQMKSCLLYRRGAFDDSAMRH